MPQIGVSILTLAVIFVVGGIPFAWAVRRRTEGWIALVIDSALFGAVAVTLAITAWTWLGVGGIVVTALLYLAAIAWLVVTKPGLPARPARLSPASWGLVAAWVALFALAIALRWHDVNFLPWVGDMGAYVNWANEFVRTGELNAGWPPVFPVFLSICSFLFGSAGTTSGMAISGILLLAVIARILGQLGVNRWIVFGVVGALAVNVHAIWFATFPGSESLNAPFFIAWLSVFVTVLRTEGRDRVAPLAVAFSSVG